MRKAKLEIRSSRVGSRAGQAKVVRWLRPIFDLLFSIFEFPSRASRWIFALGALAMTLADPTVASAQGCAMCYTAAAAAKATAIKALRSGILILLFPPGLIFIAILVVAYRRRNSFNEPEETAEEREIRVALERLEPVEPGAMAVAGRAGTCGAERSAAGN